MYAQISSKTISLMYLKSFNESILYRLSKSRIVSIEPPDPAGQKGRPRQQWRATTESGERYYSEEKPEVGSEPKTEQDKKDKGPGINDEVDSLMASVAAGKVSSQDAGGKFKEFFGRAAGKIRELKGSVQRGTGEAKTLGEAMQGLQDFSEKLSAAGGDPSKLSAAAEAFKKAAGKIQEVSDNLGGGKKEEKKPEEGSIKEPESKFGKPEAGKKNSVIYEKAALGTASWEGKIEEIEKGMQAKTTKRSAPQSSGNKSGVFFDTTESGVKVAFKPDALEDPVSESRRSLRADVSGSHREVAGFELDRILGFGIVPPTFVRESDVSDSDIQELAKNNPKLAKKKGGKMSGSSQYFVKGRDYESIDKERAQKDKDFSLQKFYSEMSDKGKLNMQKMAVLDFITGNTDRHAGNIMIDGDNVHAIDNGRCFPGKDRSQFNSRPLAALRASKEKIHPKIIEAVKSVDKTKVVAMMKAHGMEEEAKHVLERINDVLKSSGEFQLL